MLGWNIIIDKGHLIMTSEICVMNRMSVVLAADSATTVSYYENGQQVQRYFKGANKIFQLSESQPVGVMIYGNADLLGTPWELIIKDFRKKLGDAAFPKIADYATEFCKYINKNKDIFDDELRYNTFMSSFNFDVYMLLEEFNKKLKADKGFDEAAHLKEFTKAVDQKDFTTPSGKGLEQRAIKGWLPRLLKEFHSSDDLLLKDAVGNRDDNFIESVFLAVLKAKVRNNPMSPTGIVIAGYGDIALYPELYTSKNCGFIADTFVMNDVSEFPISSQNPSYISGFAQSSMADTFLIGFDAQVYKTIGEVQKDELPTVVEPFVASLGATINKTKHGHTLVDSAGKIILNEADFENIVISSTRGTANSIMKASRQKHGAPMERVISMLPVEEMTELAETMIDLQSLKEKVTQPSETVGGPVDVAIVTRNEGFIWKKRKHFFDGAINHRYINSLANRT